MSGRAFAFVIALIAILFLFKACSDIGERAWEIEQQEADKAAREAEHSRTPDMVPPLAARAIDPAAIAKAENIPTEKHCHVLGKALRGKDSEFTRAMIQRTADLQLGVLRFGDIHSITDRKIHLGMTPCMAVAAWGRPEKINRSVGSFGTHEQWVYQDNYLYFEDGILTSWQD